MYDMKTSTLGSKPAFMGRIVVNMYQQVALALSVQATCACLGLSQPIKDKDGIGENGATNSFDRRGHKWSRTQL